MPALVDHGNDIHANAVAERERAHGDGTRCGRRRVEKRDRRHRRIRRRARRHAHADVAAGTSKVIVNKIAADIKRLMAQAETKQRVQELGFDIVASTPEEFAAQVKSEIEKWGKVIKASGLKAE